MSSTSRGGTLIPNKSLGRLTFAEVTLERGATQDKDLFDWFLEVANTASCLGLNDVEYKRNLDIVQPGNKGSGLDKRHFVGYSLFMVRPIREDYRGAWHHVMNRGRNRTLIFMDDDDALDFLNAVGDTVERFGIEVHAVWLWSCSARQLAVFLVSDRWGTYNWTMD